MSDEQESYGAAEREPAAPCKPAWPPQEAQARGESPVLWDCVAQGGHQGRGPGSHLHRGLNWEKISQWCVCCSPREHVCRPTCSWPNGRATLARVHHRPCGPCILQASTGGW